MEFPYYLPDNLQSKISVGEKVIAYDYGTTPFECIITRLVDSGRSAWFRRLEPIVPV
jgi:hypothetical protein